MTSKTSILIIDDDPTHLEIYRLIVESAGFKGLTLLASLGGMEFPDQEPVSAVLLDYRLAPNLSARSVALEVKARYPFAPIALLSNLYMAPADVAPLVQAFIRKGNPEKLIAELRTLVVQPVNAK
jgi:DNA-binding NtrC family response regulator